MSAKSFFLQLAGVTLLAAAVIYALNTIPKLQNYGDIGWASIAVFFLLTLLMYYFGKQAAHSDNKHNFTNVFLGFTTGKIFLMILVILGYSKLVEPETKFFIVPFFSMYLIYTIFET